MKKLVYLFLLVATLTIASACHRDVCPGAASAPDQHSAICKK